MRIERGEIFLLNVHIPPYSHLSQVEYQPTRTRKLLMHRSEIDRLGDRVQVKGLTLIPLEMYFSNYKESPFLRGYPIKAQYHILKIMKFIKFKPPIVVRYSDPSSLEIIIQKLKDFIADFIADFIDLIFIR